jgi:hypothetical protein
MARCYRRRLVVTACLASAVAVVLVGFVVLSWRVATADPPSPTTRVVLPGIACDSCAGQRFELTYLGLRVAAASSPASIFAADPRTSIAVWYATDPTALLQNLAVPGLFHATNVIAPTRPAPGFLPLTPSVVECKNALMAAGWMRADAPPLIVPITISTDDALASATVHQLSYQWGRCGIAVTAVKLSQAQFQQALSAGQFVAFIRSVQTTEAEPFQLLKRLYGSSSPENYTGLPRWYGTPNQLLDSLIAAAEAAADPTTSTELYLQANGVLFPNTSLPGSNYFEVQPLFWTALP